MAIMINNPVPTYTSTLDFVLWKHLQLYNLKYIYPYMKANHARTLKF